MNREFLLLGVALLTSGAAIAQPYQATSIAYDWVEISGLGINSGIVGDDQLPVSCQSALVFLSMVWPSTRFESALMASSPLLGLGAVGAILIPFPIRSIPTMPFIRSGWISIRRLGVPSGTTTTRQTCAISSNGTT